MIRLLAFVRLVIVPLALVQVLNQRGDFPPGYQTAAWTILGVHALLATLLVPLSFAERRRGRAVALLGLAFDTLLSTALILVYSFEAGQPLRTLLFLVVLEAALLFRVVGGLTVALAGIPILVLAEIWRSREFGFEIQPESIVLRVAIAVVLGVVVGRLVAMEREQAALARARAQDAERLRDELGRRVDVLEASSRCARALGSSLELDQAFSAFIAELRGLVSLDRAAILLFEDEGARVMATAGSGADSFFAPGTRMEIAGSILERVAEGETVYRDQLGGGRYAEEEGLLRLGLLSRVTAPLQLGTRTIGALSVGRAEPAAFAAEEVELVSLLGRFVAAAVQNIRTYEAERTTVEELRRLSALRADFVSLVSHELRSPMAAVIGATRTLQTRWRDLRTEQRDAFLAVIGDETGRLSDLVGDVLDTSRIEAGTFGYTFTDVDLADLLREATAAVTLGQDAVRLEIEVPSLLPRVRGDRDRLRQLVDNLLANAIKYSERGTPVEVDASARNGIVRVRVRDFGPGIALEDHALIFEKFGRSGVAAAKPGTGLGLFISRSFAEAHGGTLRVDSRPGAGATFTLTLPAET
ncbi:MAG: ATP-binding protein [Gaiellaceae bacterium MAG52_C11]|nr:ATP-binding protein [Candidatus Gaiellasilicea maunaloa]